MQLSIKERMLKRVAQRSANHYTGDLAPIEETSTPEYSTGPITSLEPLPIPPVLSALPVYSTPPKLAAPQHESEELDSFEALEEAVRAQEDSLGLNDNIGQSSYLETPASHAGLDAVLAELTPSTITVRLIQEVKQSLMNAEPYQSLCMAYFSLFDQRVSVEPAIAVAVFLSQSTSDIHASLLQAPEIVTEGGVFLLAECKAQLPHLLTPEFSPSVQWLSRLLLMMHESLTGNDFADSEEGSFTFEPEESIFMGEAVSHSVPYCFPAVKVLETEESNTSQTVIIETSLAEITQTFPITETASHEQLIQEFEQFIKDKVTENPKLCLFPRRDQLLREFIQSVGRTGDKQTRFVVSNDEFSQIASRVVKEVRGTHKRRLPASWRSGIQRKPHS